MMILAAVLGEGETQCLEKQDILDVLT